MIPKTVGDYVRFRGTSKYRATIHCQKCGSKMFLRFPMKSWDFDIKMFNFSLNHVDCEDRMKKIKL